jgi:hypothetical protein
MLYDTKGASEYLLSKHGLKRSTRTLQNLRQKGGGPAYTKPSSRETLYSDTDLDAWVAKLTERRFENSAQEAAAIAEAERDAA